MQKSKDFNMARLLDFYSEMLSPQQREAMDLFYNGDLSLSEISEEIGITRQGVRDRIVKGEKIISELEEKLHMAQRFEETESAVSHIVSRLREIEKSSPGIEVDDIIAAAERLR